MNDDMNNFIKKNVKGQSTIEFIISFSIAFGFLISFYKIAMLFTNGYLVHYATFQASRVYMIADNHQAQVGLGDSLAATRASDMFKSYKLDVLISGFENNISFNGPASNLGINKNIYVGVRVEYTDSLLIPGTSKRIAIPMRSESFLGMEPTRADCFKRICDAIRELGADCMAHTTVTDNGC